MKKEILNNKIESFWNWFEENEQHIRDAVEDELAYNRNEIVESINNKILDFGLFTWEIGQENAGGYFFTISPNGSKELFGLSRHIVKSAPDLSSWVFNYARPAKDWDMIIGFFDDNMIERSVDVSAWRCSLNLHPNNKIEITVIVENLEKLSKETKENIVDLAVTNTIGEEQKIRNVINLNIINASNDDCNDHSFSINVLMQEVEKTIAAQSN